MENLVWMAMTFPTCAKDLSTHAVEAMKETILKSENPMTIIAIGPLTNIAILLSTYP